jgi:hypothetical protein
MDGFLGGSTQIRPGQSEYPKRLLIESKSISLTLPVQVQSLQTIFCYRITVVLKMYSWVISSEVHLNWSQLRGPTTESKSVKPANDAVLMPSWFTHGQFLEDPFAMVFAKWLAESKSLPRGLRRFETYL